MEWITFNECDIRWSRDKTDPDAKPMWKLYSLGELDVKVVDISSFKGVFLPKYLEFSTRPSMHKFVFEKEFACCLVKLEDGTYFYADVNIIDLRRRLRVGEDGCRFD